MKPLFNKERGKYVCRQSENLYPLRKRRRWTCKLPQRALCSKWYPDGGDGGKGGDVIFEVDKGMNALTDYRHKSKYAAGNGEGGKKRCHGANGKILY